LLDVDDTTSAWLPLLTSAGNPAQAIGVAPLPALAHCAVTLAPPPRLAVADPEPRQVIARPTPPATVIASLVKLP
jgi:hypothetical protein